MTRTVVSITPGSGEDVAVDDIGGVNYQLVKLTHGKENVAADVTVDDPLPVEALRVEDLLAMLGRLVKMMESNQVVDQQQRQRITLDAITANLTLPTVNTVNGIGTLTTLSNMNANAGMDREQYINIARQTYARSVRNQLQFS